MVWVQRGRVVAVIDTIMDATVIGIAIALPFVIVIEAAARRRDKDGPR